MDELKKALDIALTGPEADKAVALACKQIAHWGLVMPNVTPLPLDFGLHDFKRIGEVEFWIANEVEAGYCGKFLFVFDAQTCPTHYHAEKHETFYVVKGRVRMQCHGKTHEMKEGDVLSVVPGQHHAFTGIGPALLLEVSNPSMVDDNYFDNPNIPIGGNYRGK